MGRDILIPSLDAETQCSVCVYVRRMSAAPHRELFVVGATTGKFKRLFSERPE
jgi:hypothetical protein